VQVQHHLVLTSALNGGSRLASCPNHHVLGKNSPSYQMNEWVDSRTMPGSTGEEEKELCGLACSLITTLRCFRLTGSELTHNLKTWESNVAFALEYHARHEYKQLGSNSPWRWV